MLAELQQVFVFSLQEERALSRQEPIWGPLNRIFADEEKIFLLQGSGFNMLNQIEQWTKEFDGSAESKKRLVEKIVSDVTGFYHEFLSKRDVFPFDLEFRWNPDGQKLVYATKYDRPLEDITCANERDGMLLEGVKRAIELMKEAEPNTVVFLTSPAGWSGLPTGEHPDSQTYVYWIHEEGKLEAMTLRTDIIDLESSEKLVGIERQMASTKKRIKNVVSTPVKMKVIDDGFEEVLNRIEEASNRKFPKLRNEIRNRNTYRLLLSEEDKEIKIILNQLREYIEQQINGNDDVSIKRLAMAIGKAVLDMQYAVNERISKFTFNNQTSVANGFDSPEIKYQMLYQEVRQILGCSNGIQERSRSFGFDSKGPLEFRCHACNGINTRPYEGYLSECRYCHVKFDKCIT